jgi:hypothetical protein
VCKPGLSEAQVAASNVSQHSARKDTEGRTASQNWAACSCTPLQALLPSLVPKSCGAPPPPPAGRPLAPRPRAPPPPAVGAPPPPPPACAPPVVHSILKAWRKAVSRQYEAEDGGRQCLSVPALLQAWRVALPNPDAVRLPPLLTAYIVATRLRVHRREWPVQNAQRVGVCSAILC